MRYNDRLGESLKFEYKRALSDQPVEFSKSHYDRIDNDRFVKNIDDGI
jgi:hypothetical protein